MIFTSKLNYMNNHDNVEEDIDGQAFLDLKEEEVKSLFPKLGHVKVLQLQVSVTKSVLLVYVHLCSICVSIAKTQCERSTAFNIFRTNHSDYTHHSDYS